MRTVEPCVLLRFNDIADDLWNTLEFVSWRVIRDTDDKGNASLKHPAVIANAAAQQVGVREYDLLTGEAAYTGCFQTDIFNPAKVIIEDNEITDHERFVENDGQGREQVSQNVLNGQGDSHTTDTEAGDNGGDVDAHTVKGNKDEH